jgi:signal transduction histidine kinase
VINNLLQNAYNYTPENGRVEVRVMLRDGAVNLEVTDTGIGIKEKDQPYLFSRFFRISNEPPFDIRGMGLGLFIVRALIETHGGHVWAESKFGKGSTFGFALPLFEGFMV